MLKQGHIKKWAFIGALLLSLSPINSIADESVPPIPDFAVLVDGVGFIECGTALPACRIGPTGIVSHQHFNATVTYLGNNEWQLNLTTKTKANSVYFPWSHERKPLDNDKTNDIFYYPYISGVTEKVTAHDVNWTWWGLDYPGQIFAPLVIMADDKKAQMVAATNWPPKKVSPRYAGQRLTLLYTDGMPANTQETFSAMITEVSGNTAEGNPPWQLALDQYRAWLDTKIPAAQYPEWLEKIHGYIAFGLNNMYTFNASQIKAYWDLWKEKLPWIQFWGQMNPYAGNCCGITQDGQNLTQEMWPAYNPAIIDFAKSVAAEGKHVGFYSSPYYGIWTEDKKTNIHPSRMLDTPEGRTWLVDWMAKNETYGANTHYVDTMGRGYYGTPLVVRTYFTDKTVPENSMIEGMVDIYPAAGLISGALAGGSVFAGNPTKTPENSDRTTFARMGRYLLGDRIVFMGGSNDDSKFWGPNGNYYAERQAFLLGAKFEGSRLNEAQPYDLYPNHQPGHRGLRHELLLTLIEERDRVHFWDRKPVYVDTKGLTEIPAGIDIRRFRDKNGKDLVAIENPNAQTGLSFLIDGVRVSIPERKMAMVDIEEALNEPPVLGAVNDKTIMAGQNLTFNISAEDPNENDELNLSAYPLLQNASFTPDPDKVNESTFKWTPSQAHAGQHWVTFYAKDRFGAEDQKTICLVVKVVTGDANNDGKVNEADYMIWADQYGKTAQSWGDASGDGKIDGADYTAWAENFGKAGVNLKGDFNSDGKVDGADYTIWADNYGKKSPELKGDFNKDGKVDATDHTIWADQYVKTPLPGDANGDRRVDGADYTLWADNSGVSNPDLKADFNGDGKVDSADYTVWADHFDPRKPGDATGDNIVDGADYTVWADNMAKPNPDLKADFNKDGRVDSADYTVWADHFSPVIPIATPQVAAAPTPPAPQTQAPVQLAPPSIVLPPSNSSEPEPTVQTISQNILNTPEAVTAATVPVIRTPTIRGSVSMPNLFTGMKSESKKIEKQMPVAPKTTSTNKLLQTAAPLIQQTSLPPTPISEPVEPFIQNEMRPFVEKQVPLKSVSAAPSKSVAPIQPHVWNVTEIAEEPVKAEKKPAQNWMGMLAKWLTLIAENMHRGYPIRPIEIRS